MYNSDSIWNYPVGDSQSRRDSDVHGDDVQATNGGQYEDEQDKIIECSLDRRQLWNTHVAVYRFDRNNNNGIL